MPKGQACVVNCRLAVLTSLNRFHAGSYVLSIFLKSKDSLAASFFMDVGYCLTIFLNMTTIISFFR